LAPAGFVFLWSTGFIGVKYGIPYSSPLFFVAIRMIIAAFLLGLITLIVTKRLPTNASLILKSSAVGVTLHGAYLGGCFYSVSRGMSAGLVALIVCLQPVVVSVAASFFLNEKLNGRSVIGLVLGLIGVITVIIPRISGVDKLSTAAIATAVLALLGGSSGTLMQKRFAADIPMLAGATYQYGATAIVIGAIAFITEPIFIDWTPQFVFALSWLVLALSLGAILLLFFLLQSGTAAEVSSLYYLVPAVTALMAYLLFDEKVSMVSAFGTLIAVIGVWLVTGNKSALKK
jgi:drug/metabolite transporter (DMT)-like permease